jgi:small-conductance mechanosensitive channel
MLPLYSRHMRQALGVSRLRMIPVVVIALCVLWLSPASLAQPAAEKSGGAAPATEQASLGTPVILEDRELFRIHEPMGLFSAEERAAAIVQRLRQVVESAGSSLPEVVADEVDGITYIRAGDIGIMAVTERDIAAVGRDRQEYIAFLVATLREAIHETKRHFEWRDLAQGLVIAALATLALYFFFLLTRRGLYALTLLLIRQRDRHIYDIRFQKTVLLSSWRIVRLLVLCARALWVLILFLALYIYLPLVFHFFPQTREISNRIIVYTLTPLRVLGEAFLAEIPNLFFIIVIATLTYYGIRFARFMFREVEKGNIELPGFYRDWALPTYKIVRIMMIAFSLVIAYPYIPGSESDAFKGVTIFFGVLFSLGSTGVVANAVSGVILTYTRAFVIGDRVKIGETTGDVIERTLLATRLRTVKNVDVSVPNSILLSHQIVNYSAVAREKGLILHTTVTVGYDVPWRQVHDLLIRAALDTRDILENPRPFVLQTSLHDFYGCYELNAYTYSAHRMAAIYSDLHAQIQDKFHEAGIEMTSPHFIAARDGNLTTLPPEYRPANYRVPRFQVDRYTAEEGRSPLGGNPDVEPPTA